LTIGIGPCYPLNNAKKGFEYSHIIFVAPAGFHRGEWILPARQRCFPIISKRLWHDWLQLRL